MKTLKDWKLYIGDLRCLMQTYSTSNGAGYVIVYSYLSDQRSVFWAWYLTDTALSYTFIYIITS